MTQIKKDIVVVYHSYCMDGMAAAWAALQYFGDKADYLPSAYQNTVPDFTGKTVYLVDFSYPRDTMRGVIIAAESVVLLDHHKSALEDLAPLCEEFDLDAFDMGACTVEKSGALIAWEYFFLDKPKPAVLAAIADRDIWAFKLPYTREITAGVASYPFEMELYHKFMTEPDRIEDLIVMGEALIRQHNKHVDSLCNIAVYLNIDGLGEVVPVVNANGMFASELGNRLAEHYGCAMMWYITNQRLKISLRSVPGGPDVSVFAKRYGGGGHQHAAGFDFKLSTPEATAFMLLISTDPARKASTGAIGGTLSATHSPDTAHLATPQPATQAGLSHA